MDHTSFVWTPALGPKLAAGHKADGTFKERTQYLHANAAYSLYTTPRDFAAFLLAFLNRVPPVGRCNSQHDLIIPA
jgi:CubicO group peptidase (beta-lactamase class C family)